MKLKAQTDEIGYVCSRGHYVFHADPEGSSACGSKRVGAITVSWDVDKFMNEADIDDLRQESETGLTNILRTWREA